jgi:hypothetical protein
MVKVVGPKVVKQKADAVRPPRLPIMESQKGAPMHTKQYRADKRLLALVIILAVVVAVSFQFWS